MGFVPLSLVITNLAATVSVIAAAGVTAIATTTAMAIFFSIRLLNVPYHLYPSCSLSSVRRSGPYGFTYNVCHPKERQAYRQAIRHWLAAAADIKLVELVV